MNLLFCILSQLNFIHFISFRFYFVPKHLIDLADYSIVADIRESKNGIQILFYDGFKYYKNKNGKTTISWKCSKQYKKCRASVSTTNINGVVMMKVLQAEHNHECNA